MKLMEKTAVNTGRQIEMDMAKSICILGMVIVHCFEELYGVEASDSGAQYLFQTVLDCLFGAGTFMFCMGMGIAYSPNTTADGLVRRGAKLLLFGYILNFLRFTAPWGILGLVRHDSEALRTAWTFFFDGDILPFAGLALMLFGFLKKHWSDRVIVCVAVGMSILGSFVRDFTTGMVIPDQLIGLLFGTLGEMEACFPLFNWFIFVAAGYVFALVLRRCPEKGRLYARVSPAAGAVVLVYMLFAIPARSGMMSPDLFRFYHMTTPEALVCILAAVLVMGMYYALSRFLPEGVRRLFITLSRNLNRIYLIHWVILGWLECITIDVLAMHYSDPAIFLTAVALFVVSSCLAEWYRRRKQARAG